MLSAASIALAVGCGGSSVDEERRTVPAYGVSIVLPDTWDAVDHESSSKELEDFQSEHPKFLGVGEAFDNPSRKLLAAGERGDSRLLLSIDDVPATYSLEGHIERNLLGFGSLAGARIDGPREEIIQVAGGPAWRLRWSYQGDLGRVQLVQYTLVRDGRLYLFTFSTLGRWEASASSFEASAASIRIGKGDPDAADEQTAPTGLIAFYRENEAEETDI